jgi:hypothetical protein
MGRVVPHSRPKGEGIDPGSSLMVANGKTQLAHCQHIAIYQPREQATA